LHRRLERPAILLAVLLVVSPVVAGPLTFEERVAAQEAIEQVYFAHRTGGVVPFRDAVPRRILEEKVRTYLRQSRALERLWATPVTPEMLQAELERIARSTRFPERLAQIYAALDHDPVLIQECFVRPVLVDRLARSFFAYDRRIHAGSLEEIQTIRAWLASDRAAVRLDDPRRSVLDVQRGLAAPDPPFVPGPDVGGRLELPPEAYLAWRKSLPAEAGVPGPLREGRHAWTIEMVLDERPDRARIARYRVPKRAWDTWWRGEAARHDDPAPVDVAAPAAIPEPWRAEASAACLQDDTWDNAGLDDAPDPRHAHTAVWTGTHMIVWGGEVGSYDGYLDSGALYDPLTDAWSPTSREGAPSPRARHSAVWTGSEMIVWGGGRRIAVAPSGQLVPFDTGARYDPVSDTWSPMATAGTPVARDQHRAFWTGSEMIVWSGRQQIGVQAPGGGRYDPATDSWRAMSTSGQGPGGLVPHAVWTGSEMVVWDGFPANRGARYDPATDTWSPMETAGAPSPRHSHVVSWTGSRVLVNGGFDDVFPPTPEIQMGGSYDPATNTWSSFWDPLALQTSLQSLWTGAQVFAWGPYDRFRYDPATDVWTTLSTVNAPAPAGGQSAVWAGDRLIVWGGGSGTDAGGRWDPATGTWTPTSRGSGPGPRSGHSGVWTGAEMILWGGTDGVQYLTTGHRYDPTVDAWSDTTTVGAPGTRGSPAAFWIGDRLLIWGGWYVNDGALYDPVADAWSPTSGVGAPSPRQSATFVWTGRELIVWGGHDGSSQQDTGGRYDPSADVWRTTSTVGAPAPRYLHGAAWTGDRMMVWGGATSVAWNDGTGGLYDPATDAWTAVPSAGAPEGRRVPSVVLAGDTVVVWGGIGASGELNSGGRYDPAADQWSPASPSGAPAPRALPAAVWTGRDLLVWGGWGGSLPLGDGGRYDPQTDQWAPMALIGAPGPRLYFSAVWANSHLIVWGGENDMPLRTGGRYALHNAADLDGDGTSVCAGDCDDTEPASYPGAVELCDFVDNDCDGQVDDGFDLDGDGYTTCAGDCDDGEPASFPGNAEACDALDNDCDGTVDSFPTTCGVGECASAGACVGGVDSCTPGSPTPEACDGRDNDCDGAVPADEADADGDGFAFCAGDCAPADAGVFPGAPEVNNGLDDQCPGDFGHGVVDEISGLAGFASPGSTEFCWPPQTGATLYHVGRSTVPDATAGCVTETTTGTCWDDPTAPAPGGAFFYDARALQPNTGAWGIDSTGAARAFCNLELCDDAADNDDDGRIDCEDVEDCFGSPSCPSASFAFSDTSADDVAATALQEFFSALPADPGHFIRFSMSAASGLQAFAWCAERADFFRDRYVALAATDGFVASEEWTAWHRTGTGPWVAVTDTAFNVYGASCYGPWSWCSEYAYAGRSLLVNPADAASCEAADTLLGCVGGGAQVVITVGADRLSACGF
jgi:N-acetylneuraminic acid mutarotase